MHKRLLLTLVVLCFTVMIGAVPAHAVYLDSTWYATLTNVRTYGGTYPSDPFWGTSHSSAHISVTGGSGTASFTIPLSCQASLNESASWGVVYVDPVNTLGSISFNYTTYWTQPNLVLQLWTGYLTGDPGGVVWSTAQTGLKSGHVTINANPNAYTFALVAVPEPSSALSLVSLCAIGALPFMRKRASAERNRS